MQSSYFAKVWRVKILLQLALPNPTDQGKRGQRGMKKRKKGISDDALTKIACTGLLVGSLGGIFAGAKSMALDDELSGLGDKVPSDQIQELKATSSEMEKGYSAAMAGQLITGGTMGYYWGRRAGRKKGEEPGQEEPGASR
jgi:hypothetical protein